MPSLPMTQSAAQALLSQYIPVVFEAIQDKYSITNLRDKLMNTEKVVLKTAKQVYELFTINGRNGSQLSTIDDVIRFEKELNEEIKRAKKVSESISNIGNLNGPELEKNFLSLYEKAEIFDRDLQQSWNNFLKQALSNKNITSITNEVIMENSQDIAKTIIKDLINPKSFTSASIGTTGMVHYKYSGSKGYNVGRVNEVFSKCGKNIQEAFRTYLSNNNKTTKNNSEIFFVKTSQASTYNGVSITLTVEQNNITLPIESLLKMRQEERNKFFAGMSEEKKANFIRIINESYKQYILDRCGQNSDSNLAKAIDKVIDFQDSDTLLKAFFGGGKNTKNITGILGEIQAIYFLMCLGGEQLIDSISWIGGIAKAGQKPHADLLLKNIIGDRASNYGIQVKNTTKDVSKLDFSATFQSFNFQGGATYDPKTGLVNILHTKEAVQAMKDIGMPLPGSDLMDAIETLIGMESFNIEYQRERVRTGRNTKRTIIESKNKTQVWKAVAAENQRFSATRDEIEVGAAAAQQVMAFFAATMMYMQRVGNTFGETNTIYFVAGSLIMSAASIIHNMIQEWDTYSERSFKMELGNQSGAVTIVDIINAGGDSAFNKISLGLNSSYTFIKH